MLRGENAGSSGSASPGAPEVRREEVIGEGELEDSSLHVVYDSNLLCGELVAMTAAGAATAAIAGAATTAIAGAATAAFVATAFAGAATDAIAGVVTSTLLFFKSLSWRRSEAFSASSLFTCSESSPHAQQPMSADKLFNSMVFRVPKWKIGEVRLRRCIH